MTTALTTVVRDLPLRWKKEKERYSDAGWYANAVGVHAAYIIQPYWTYPREDSRRGGRIAHYQLSWMYKRNAQENIWTYKTLQEAKAGAERHYLQRFSSHNPLSGGVIAVAVTATGVALGLLIYELIQKARA